MALYHKYRPQVFKDVIGQEHIIQTISNQIIQNTIAHAYLFSGPRGVGKTTTARLIAKAITCPTQDNSSPEPDNTKANAIEITEGRSLDVIEIDAASHTGVDNVRENIIENAQFKPTKLPYKVFIIDEVHMLSTSAFNALLKILEEPPKHVIFILATTELHKIPETIVSRCQRFAFRPIKYTVIKKYITSVAKKENVKVAEEVIDAIITKSEGCVRDAVSLLEQVLAIGKDTIEKEDAFALLPTTATEEVQQFILALVQKNATKGLGIIEKVCEEGVDVIYFIDSTISLLRDALIYTISTKENNQTQTKAVQDTLTHIEQHATSQEMVTMLQTLMERRVQIRKSPIPQLPLELAVVTLCSQTQTEATTPPPQIPVKKEMPREKTTVAQQDKVPQPDTKQNQTINNPTTITKDWHLVITKAEALSPSLVFILKTAIPAFVDDSTVTIQVDYSFQKDKLLEPRYAKKIVEILQEVYSRPIEFSVIVKEGSQKKQDSEDSSMQKLAESFGGEIVS
ncbi:MAG: DNA polymerase III subunit gamma/tau [Candidatus Magasanikbacteria bacterium]|jgi:DNA polymerase III subunit gamma/tau|nr:DNA polymerase III subunit gamma/tau [Candidatus Magasanikbacteria bacterium]MBT5262759.1 DNA polymerase III subunit gamma/tau [Candidatus Magasanikbacteria bacterium]MBT5819899.1 DNA polymerase III subunit gamma/tau [Candidatus Magasanikbacteria bacterium]MBT6294243.1 DNA polymerase III subunit gamma/tau [Candidatus Magasanikbacteria bacterium]